MSEFVNCQFFSYLRAFFRSQEQPPAGISSAKNISVDDADGQQESDIFHHSMMMDDDSDDEYHPIPNLRHADMPFKPYIDTQHTKNIQVSVACYSGE